MGFKRIEKFANIKVFGRPNWYIQWEQIFAKSEQAMVCHF